MVGKKVPLISSPVYLKVILVFDLLLEIVIDFQNDSR